MSNKSDGNQNTQSAKVLKLGFNISVSGDPGTDFEIVLDDNEQKAIQASPPKEEQLLCSDVLEPEDSITNAPKHELEKTKTREVKTHAKSTGAITKNSNTLKITHSSESGKMSESENSSPQDTSLISRIKATMEHFEKFSDHIKDIPRLRSRPLATSTPFSDKYNSKSESNLVYPESRARKFSHLYDFHSRKAHLKRSIRPSPPDLFLKPLPAEDYYMRGIYTRFIDYEPQRHYDSDNSLNKTSECKSFYGKSSYDVEKYDGCNLTAEPPIGILKKSDSECGDKQSTSSADSVKDIKIYQSGGILIMQNFKENMDSSEKKEISEFSAKLIENCNKLRMEVSGFQDDKPAIGNVAGEESKNSGKTVQFDLSSFESQKSKSGDSSSNPMKDESSESPSDCMKNKDTSPQGTSQSQDLTSLSTQENDSFMSNPAGTSPTYASSKKLEWDSGADVGYLNLDLSKENLSTIEKIVLKGLSSDGLSEENIVYEKKSNSKNRSKFTMERIPSSVLVEAVGGEPGIKSKEEEKKKSLVEHDNDFKSRTLREDETEKRKNTERISSGENFKDGSRPKFEETKESKNSPKEIPAANEIHQKEKELELTDKSVHVNTLFDNLDWVTPPRQFIQDLIRPTESHGRPTPRRLAHSPKTKVSKAKSRPPSQRFSKASRKSNISSHITGPLVASYFDMGNPKTIYKKIEASPVLNEGELSREVDEIIIDQRFKIKQSSGRETSKEPDVPVKDGNSKEVKAKSRPISASSSSNNTVLPKSESEEKTKKSEKYSDQMIQTSDRDCESVGVQAFASQVSSDCDFKSSMKNPTKAKVKENLIVSSKNIQAFGLNSSLPKQLEHPTGKESIDNQNTKSTQFFGGPLNSLPNYHSNLVTKPGESCGRVPNVLKTKMISEVIRVREENEKNILANDQSKPGELSRDSRKSKSKENKENLITKTNSRSQSNASHEKNSGTGSGDSENKTNKKGRKTSVDSSDPLHGSDDVSSLVLTSEVLKVHGDSIDRNIIKEKYFQSQLVELEKRQMISRSTSMEIQIEGGAAGREYITTGCQYSPQSRGTSEGQEPEELSFKGVQKNRIRRVRDGCVGQNAGDGLGKNQDQNMETGGSLPSSTQTAHSWVPGMRNSNENSSGVGKARSFEYLPGHIYESSGNLREELPSETEQNLITSSSSESDTARGSVSIDGGRDSEGRNTLILENSTDNSHDSDDRLKILDVNLSKLSFAILKLSEKDAQVENMTRSLLANLCSKSGCGDCLPLGGAETSKTEVGDNKDITDNGKHQIGTPSEITAQAAKEGEEFSVACQTEEKSPSPHNEKFFEERKALEKRISEEKKCQIKWIENEIHHLNILRELLEKQSSPAQRKKKRSFLSTASSDNSKSEDNYPKNISTEVCLRPVTPVYGCTISLTENVPPECSQPATTQNDSQQREREPCPSQYGLAVSLSGCSTKWRRVVMLPVGVQVSLNDTSEHLMHCSDAERSAEIVSSHSHRKNSSGSENMVMQKGAPPCSVHTQFPSLRKNSTNLPRASVQTDLPSPKFSQCSKEQCFCLNLSDKSCTTSSRSKAFEKRGSAKLHFIDEECDTEDGNQTSNSLEPEILEMDPTPLHEKVVNKNESTQADPSQNFAKSKSVHGINCKCQNVPRRASPPLTNQVVSCQGTCQTNISNSLEELGSCHCSRVQIKKSSNNCHIIKIHGSKCCSPENSSCSLKRQSVARKTENQTCQTENEPVIIKDLINYPEISKASEAPQVKSSCDVKVGIERPKQVVKKLPCSTKTPYQVIHSSPEARVMEKIALERDVPANDRTSDPKSSPENTPESDDPVKGKPVVPDCTCCKKRERAVDDHPRHYFLRIEEAEVDEPMEPNPRKKSLEVVTVTVPVKRAGKSKIYGSDVQQSRDSLRDKVTGCSCCSACSRNRREPTRDDQPRTSSSCQKFRAEKPSSPVRRTGPCPTECDRYENMNFYNPPYDEFYTQEPYPVPPSHEDRPVNGGYGFEECICSSRNMPPSREIQNGYDCYKKAGNRFRGETNQRERRNDVRTPYDDQSSECLPSQVQAFNEDPDCYDPEFYNYNKREFMTKSELLKEDEKKRKVHQPSLQEYLTSNRPDFYNSAERRRQIISERANERLKKHNSRMECVMKMIHHCDQQQPPSEPKRIFTTVQMREQTMKRYRKLPEVTGKIADEKKKAEYRTNRLMADIFAKKLQNEALKGHINLSNSVSVLYTL